MPLFYCIMLYGHLCTLYLCVAVSVICCDACMDNCAIILLYHVIWTPLHQFGRVLASTGSRPKVL